MKVTVKKKRMRQTNSRLTIHMHTTDTYVTEVLLGEKGRS